MTTPENDKHDPSKQTLTPMSLFLGLMFYITLGLSIGSIVLMAAWNLTIPTLFSLPAINFSQSISLIMLGLLGSQLFWSARGYNK